MPIEVVVSHLLKRSTRWQVRRPRSKRRRIRRKWAKDPRNWRERQAGPDALWVEGVLYVTPELFSALSRLKDGDGADLLTNPALAELSTMRKMFAWSLTIGR